MTARPEIWRDIQALWEAAAAPRLPLDEWAAKYRIVTQGAHQGRWRARTVPMVIEPMRAASDRRVSQITVCAPAQLMKSDFCVSLAAWAAINGDDVLFWEPDRELAERFHKTRIREAVFAADVPEPIEPPGRRRRKEDRALSLQVPGGGLILCVTPEMKTGKSSHTARVAVIDEIDKMKDPTMISVAESRTLTYGSDAVIVAVSTPTIDAPGTIFRLWSEGSRGVWHGKCRHCGDLVRVDWSRVKFDSDEDGFWLPSTWRMPCDSCGVLWSESDRQMAVRGGQYIHANPDNPHRSFQVPGPAHVFRDLRWMVERGARAYRDMQIEGASDAYKLFVNERQGEPWTDEHEGLSARKMQRATYSLGARGKDDLGELDRRVLLLTAGTDAGAHGLYTEFVAWGIQPKTGQVMCWGLQYRITGGTPTDDLDTPEMWGAYFRLLENSVWRHQAFPGLRMGLHQVLVDSGGEFSPVVRTWLEKKYDQDMGARRAEMWHPYGAVVLPCFGKSRDIGEHLVDLSQGSRQPTRGQQRRLLAQVGLHTGLIKDTVYATAQRDQRLPEGADLQMIWPVDLEARGYTEAYFREYGNEVRHSKFTPKGGWGTHWDQRIGKAKMNEAWDCRIYAMGAALTHCVLQGSMGLQIGLLRRALRQGVDNENRWTEDEMADLRKHLDILGASGYPSGGENVETLR